MHASSFKQLRKGIDRHSGLGALSIATNGSNALLAGICFDFLKLAGFEIHLKFGNFD